MILVKRKNLAWTLKENREKHLKHYEEAKNNWFVQTSNQLAAMAETIRNQKELPKSTHELIKGIDIPVNFVDDYDAAILRFEWDTRDQIELTQAEFQQFVMDKWQWAPSFASNTLKYSG